LPIHEVAPPTLTETVEVCIIGLTRPDAPEDNRRHPFGLDVSPPDEITTVDYYFLLAAIAGLVSGGFFRIPVILAVSAVIAFAGGYQVAHGNWSLVGVIGLIFTFQIGYICGLALFSSKFWRFAGWRGSPGDPSSGRAVDADHGRDRFD
jgi:hypothetical protein